MHNLKCISTKIAVYGVDNDANFVSNVEGTCVNCDISFSCYNFIQLAVTAQRVDGEMRFEVTAAKRAAVCRSLGAGEGAPGRPMGRFTGYAATDLIVAQYQHKKQSNCVFNDLR